MKRLAFRLVVLAMPIATLGASAEVSRIELTLAGDLREPSPMPSAGVDWFAIGKMGSQYELVSTSVELQPAPESCGSITRVVAPGVSEPLFLIRGSPHFRSGVLDTVFEGRRFLLPSENMSLQLKSGTWFAFQAYGSAKPGQGGPRVTGYQVVLLQGRQEQVIVDLPIIDMDKPPSLQWAGDLDRDNKLDAIFDLSTHYASQSFVLFLSSQAESGKLVRDVAKLHIPGC